MKVTRSEDNIHIELSKEEWDLVQYGIWGLGMKRLVNLTSEELDAIRHLWFSVESLFDPS